MRYPALILVALLTAAGLASAQTKVTPVEALRLTTVPCQLTSGTAAPSGGNNCDMYQRLDGTTSTFYIKSGGSWVPLASGTFVNLQAGTPGTPQTGHLNISGTVLAGDVSTGAGTFTGAFLVNNSTAGMTFQTGAAPGIGASGQGLSIQTALNPADSGVHDLLAGTLFAAPSFGLGDAAVTDAATVVIDGPPAGGTHPYALLVNSGAVKFATGDLIVGAGNVGIKTTPTVFALQVAGDVGPNATYAFDLGSDAYRWKALKAVELDVWRLVTKDVVASVGGEIWTAETTVTTAALADGSGDTTLTVKDNNLASGDFVVLKSLTNIEWLKVTSSAGGSAGAYTYTVERDKDGTGRDVWPSGSAVVNTGTTGDGLIAQYATDGALASAIGAKALTGPTVAGFARTGTTWNNLAARWAVGNLVNLYDYTGATYGFAAGDYAETWVSVDATNGFRVMHGATAKVSVDGSGNATFTGTVEAGAGHFGGWSIDATDIYAGTGASRVQLSTAGQATYKATVLADTPVSYWTFGDADCFDDGYANDSASSRDDLLWHVPMTLYCHQAGVNAYMGYATTWNAANVYTYLAHQAQWNLGDTFTITGWFKREVHDAAQTVLDMGAGGAHVYVSAGNYLYLQKKGGNDIAYSAVLDDDTNWHRFAIVHSPDSTLFYLDNDAEAHTNTANYTDNFDATPTGNLAVGVENDLSSQKFQGLLQHLAIFSTALSSTRIAAQWTASTSTVAEGQAIWAGCLTFDCAPFSVTAGGDLKATRGTIGGLIITDSGIRNASNTLHIDADGESVFGRVSFSAGSAVNVDVSDSGTNDVIVGRTGATKSFNMWWNTGGTGGFSINSGVTMTLGAGVQIGSPTGGDKGAGTLNVAGGVWDNGTRLVNFTTGSSWGGDTCEPGKSVTSISASDGIVSSMTCSYPSPLQEMASLRAQVADLQARLSALEGGRR